MGLVQRKIEEAGFSTIALSNIPVFTASVGAPRVAAIEYPFGETLGKPGDSAGQMAVVRACLQALVELKEPGTVVHLPFEWPEKDRPRPVQPPPISDYIKKHPWHLPRLVTRDIPEEFRIS